MSKKSIGKSVLALGMGSLFGVTALVGAPATATAAQVTAYDCKTVVKRIDANTAVREKSCVKNVGSLFPVWARVVVSKQYIKGGHWV